MRRSWLPGQAGASPSKGSAEAGEAVQRRTSSPQHRPILARSAQRTPPMGSGRLRRGWTQRYGGRRKTRTTLIFVPNAMGLFARESGSHTAVLSCAASIDREVQERRQPRFAFSSPGSCSSMRRRVGGRKKPAHRERCAGFYLSRTVSRRSGGERYAAFLRLANRPVHVSVSRKLRSLSERDGWRSLRKALASI